MPKQKTFIVTSIFNSGLAEFDNNIALINLSTLEDFFGFQQEQRNLEIYLKRQQLQMELLEKFYFSFASPVWITSFTEWDFLPPEVEPDNWSPTAT